MAVIDPHWLDIGGIQAAYRQGTLTPLRLVEALIDRIDRVDPLLNSIVHLDRRQVLEDARAATAELKAGRPMGPLHGVPIGIKDIIDVAGQPTTCHSRFMLGNIARHDAALVSRLRMAGAIIMGKLATHEFAIGGPSFDLPFPPARNPWNRHHHPGGSSSGSGVAVAAGLMPAAIGTDTAGSIRNPASGCGIVGLKPAYGAVPLDGVFPLAPSLDHAGPMTRNVADALLLLSVLSGDPVPPLPSVQGLRIGFIRHFHERDIPATPEVAAALENVAHRLSAEGCIVTGINVPALTRFAAANLTIMQAEAAAIHADRLRNAPGIFAARTRAALLPGLGIEAGRLDAARVEKAVLTDALTEAAAACDVVMTASSMDVPARFDDDDAITRGYGLQARTVFNLTGWPAIVLPAGLSHTGLPLSVQFAAAKGREACLFAVAKCLDRLSSSPPI
ncbi:amidase [Niveispirillum fermenti]|uniref:amidase n=1 Tax=Niveispirillum fermenti TaxID=1233113 RepID=UPI003A84C05E